MATSQTAVTGSSCPGAVVFVGAAGSGDTLTAKDPFGPTVSIAWRQFKARIPSAVPQPVKYAAQSLFDSLLKGYAPSYSDGLVAMYDASYVPALACRNDSSFKLVYAGFSQGAHVVGDYAQNLIPENRGDARELSAIAGIALIGDPRFDSSTQDHVGGGSGPGLFSVPLDYGISYGLRSKFSGSLSGKARSYCLPQDAVCDTPAFLLQHGLSMIGKSRTAATLILQAALTLADVATVHNVEGSVLGVQAGNFLADQVLGAPGPSAQTSAPLPPPAVVSPVSSVPSVVPGSTAVAPSSTMAPSNGQPASLPPQETTSRISEPSAADVHAPPVSDPGQDPLPVGASELGSVDLERYCSDGWGLHAHLRYAVTWGWRCGIGTGQELHWQPGDQDVSVNDACSQQWTSSAKSHYRNYYDPGSWFCWTA